MTRRRTTVVDSPPADATTVDPNKVVHTFQDIAFFIDGQPAGGQRYTGADAGSSGAPTLIGKALLSDQPGSAPASLRGALSEVRIWSVARPQANIGIAVTGSETGLVGWWRFAENAGSTTADSKSTNTATLHGAVTWITTPDPAGSQLVLYRDGTPMKLGKPQAALASVQSQFTVGALQGGKRAGLPARRARRAAHLAYCAHGAGDPGQPVQPPDRRPRGPARLLPLRPAGRERRERLRPARPRPGRDRGLHSGRLHRAARRRHPPGPRRAGGRADRVQRHARDHPVGRRVRRARDRRQRQPRRRVQALLRTDARRALAARERLQGRRRARRVGRPGPVRPAADRLHRGRPAGAQREPDGRGRLRGRQRRDAHRGRQHDVHLRVEPGHRL